MSVIAISLITRLFSLFVGEFEPLDSLRKHYSFCADHFITQDSDIECVAAKDGKLAPKSVTCNRKTGLACVNSPSAAPCPDYLVRFW